MKHGEPIRWDPIEDSTRDQQQAVADEIVRHFRELYDGLDAELRA